MSAEAARRKADLIVGRLVGAARAAEAAYAADESEAAAAKADRALAREYAGAVERIAALIEKAEAKR